MPSTKLTPSKPKFSPVSINSIKPEGWLWRQLRIQEDGLCGHLDEFWPDIKDSGWFGGDQEGWERAPYWLDGVVPLAFLLEDRLLEEKVHRYVDYILKHQGSDGWLGPRVMRSPAEQDGCQNFDIWSQFLIGKVLMQYHDATGDERVISALTNNLRRIGNYIDETPLFNWAQFRWFEALMTLYWLHELRGGAWLLELAVKLHAQGFNWEGYFEHWPHTEPTQHGKWSFMSHVVNNAMALKSPALWSQITGNERHQQVVYKMLDLLDQYHGVVTGVITGDECLAGKKPTQGTELCAVVEFAYSLEVLLTILGDPILGDRLEKIIFNALPAAFLPDMWSHQYDQQINQVECSIKPRLWTTNGPESNIYGLQPHYGCCTANFSQGWPKFARSLWMVADKNTQAEGLAAVAYAPSRVDALIKGVMVNARLDTDYPFRDTLDFVIQTSRPVEFPFHIRIPSWAKQACVCINGKDEFHPQPGAFFVIDRDWEGRTEIALTLPMHAELISRQNNAISIQRGPLIYGLRIEEELRRVNIDQPYRELPHADWEIYPKSSWNYALDVSATTLDKDIEFLECPVRQSPFSQNGAPVVARVYGRKIAGWQLQYGSAGEIPLSPIKSNEPLEELTLVPFGCTSLRIAEFPILWRDGS
jgi:hypothetical protein